MKIFLTAFGLHNPATFAPLPDHAAIPIAADADGCLDLDYSALLLASKFVIDQEALAYVDANKDTFLRSMSRSLATLKNEGFLEVQDYGDICRPHVEAIEQKTDALIEYVDPWIDIVRKQWLRVKDEFREFQELYADQSRYDVNTTHYGITSYLLRKYGEVDTSQSDRLHKLLESRRTRFKTSEIEELREIVRPLVAQVVINNLIGRSLMAPFIDWDDAQEFYRRLEFGQWTEMDAGAKEGLDAAMVVQSRHLFQIVLPELLPNRIEDVVRFIRNRRAVQSLRRDLWELLQEGKSVTPQWMLSLQTEASKAQLRAEGRGRVIKWVGRVANILIPGAGVAGEAILAGAEDLAERLWQKQPDNRFEWYYALQRIGIQQ